MSTRVRLGIVGLLGLTIALQLGCGVSYEMPRGVHQAGRYNRQTGEFIYISIITDWEEVDDAPRRHTATPTPTPTATSTPWYWEEPTPTPTPTPTPSPTPTPDTGDSTGDDDDGGSIASAVKL